MTLDTILWAAFLLIVGVALTFDLSLFHRRPHVLSLREAALWTAGWVSFAVVVGIGVWVVKGGGHALDFLTGYIIEWSLSMDNVFVFAALFAYFVVPPRAQHPVLFWGIVGAAAMRLLFILTGVALLERFEWMLYIFGGILIATAVRMLLVGDHEPDVSRNLAVRAARRLVRITDRYHDERFFIRLDGRLFATPLFLALVAVEASDVIFAVDSVPAILAITRDPFIVFSSNLCAILGLRALYFLLGGLMALFRYLHIGLAAILFLIGVKMLLEEVVHIETWMMLAMVFVIIGIATAASILVRERAAPPKEPRDAPASH